MAQLPDRPGPQLIVKMINDANSTTFTVNDFTFGQPEPSTRPNYDTQIDMTFVAGPYSGITKRFYYNRLDLALLIGLSNSTFQDNGTFVNTAGALNQINTRRGLFLSLSDVVDTSFEIGPYPANLTLTAESNSLVLLPDSVVQITITQPDPADPSALALDLTYVDQESPTFIAFVNYVDNAIAGGPAYDISALDAAYAYRITGEEQYRLLAIAIVEQDVTAAEERIALGQIPTIASDNYLDIGPRISALATTYAWCNPDAGQKVRWAAYADRAIGNIWDHTNAYWGETPAPWTGWSVSDPGNNYFYSFCVATATWALASGNEAMYVALQNDKLDLLNTYMTNMLGGGSREGTGYGVALMNLFDLYMFLKDSGQIDYANINNHLTGSIYYWAHATMPTLNKYCPIGDLSRESYPWLFDYHRSLMLKARHLTTDQTAQNIASWWLNNISVQTMQQGWQRKYNLLPAGDYNLPPENLSYRAEGPGCLFARTSWETDAVYFHFLAGTYDQSHAHQAQGSFVFFKSDFLTVTPNIFSHSGIQQNVTGQNVLRFNNSSNAVIPQTYGSAVMSSNINGINGNATAQATLTDIMNDATVESWQRDVNFQNGVLGVVDSFSTNSGTTATFQVCVKDDQAPPIIDGNEIIAGDLAIIIFDPPEADVTLTDMSTVDADYNQGWRINIAGGVDRYEVEMRSISHSGSGAGTSARPRFQTQPVSQSANSGESLTFTCLATGPGTIEYLWEIRVGGVWYDTGDVGTSTTITNLTTGSSGWKVRVSATNANGTTVSRIVTITVSNNIAPGYTEVTSGMTWSQSSEFDPSLVVNETNLGDGDSTTGAATYNGPDQFIKVDLGTPKPIGRMSLAGGVLPLWGPIAFYLNGRHIQYSTDNEAWSTVALIEGIDDTGTPVNFDFTPVTAQYWRIQSDGWLSVSGMRLYETSGG